MPAGAVPPPKAGASDLLGRFREVISDPLNLLIERVPQAGILNGNEVWLHNGNRVPVSGSGAYYGSFSQLLVLNRGVHEPLEEYIFQEVLKRMPAAPRMIELGAYWAHYSMWLRKQRADAEVIMIEPDPTNLAAGRANFSRNGFSGEFIQAAAARGHWELDPFVKSRSISHIDILHVDIQGYEVELLEGGRDTLGNGLVDYLFVSTHSQDLHQRVASELSGLGYRLEVSSDFENDTTSFDGLVFASCPKAKQIFGQFPHVGRTKIGEISPVQLLDSLIKTRESSL